MPFPAPSASDGSPEELCADEAPEDPLDAPDESLLPDDMAELPDDMAELDSVIAELEPVMADDDAVSAADEDELDEELELDELPESDELPQAARVSAATAAPAATTTRMLVFTSSFSPWRWGRIGRVAGPGSCGGAEGECWSARPAQPTHTRSRRRRLNWSR
ncbi:hypothetical protein GCM10011594_26450 [Nakamurella endophytica]|uniref:Uncharacterized protein n=1 Tax=Nakamurella endophytica TaxID=1748367 RepID=A0A917SZH8_9ACTN|nr:hypothetical protein GCM10011594_26450 [Nakamurella endophytica]